MNITSNISNLFGRVVLKPVQRVVSLAQTALDKISGGRGLKLWAQPAIREIKSKDKFHEFSLENGLKVLVKRAQGTQVKTELIINSGASKEPKGKEGLAHFLEHVACSSTSKFGKKVSELCELHGGSYNAYTSARMTRYESLLPADKLDLGLGLAAGVMGDIKIDANEFNKEKGVISTEVMREESNTGHKIIKKLNEIRFGKDHPLTTNVIGDKASVQSMTETDLYEFKQREYVPNNATLVVSVSDDIDLVKLKRLVTRYFSGFKPDANFKEPDLSQGIKPSSQRDHVLQDNTLTSGLTYIYAVPKFNHRESMIMGLISHVLVSGNDSRLHKKLVDGEANAGQAAAQDVSSGASTDKFTGHFIISAKPLDDHRDKNFATIARVINEELTDLAINGISEKEFSLAMSQMEAHEVYKKDHQHSGLGEVEHYHREGEDWTKSLTQLEDLRTITNDEVKAFVAKYLLPSNRHSLKVIGNGKDLSTDYQKAIGGKVVNDAQGAKAEEQVMTAEKYRELVSLSNGLSDLSISLTDLQKSSYPNGMQLYHKHDTSLPLVFVKVNFTGGSLAIPEEMEASLGMLDALLSETGTYNPKTGQALDKKAIKNMTDRLGMGFSQGSSMDTGSVELATLSKNSSKSLALMMEILNNPAILETQNPEIVKHVEAEFKRLKTRAIDQLKSIKKLDPKLEIAEAFSRAMYPKGHKFYDKDIDQAIRDVEKIQLADLRNIYKKLFHAKNAQITVVGNMSKQEIDSSLVPILDTWNKANQGSNRQPDYSRIAPVEPPRASIKIIPAKDNKPEAHVMIGNPMDIKVDDADHMPAMLANYILGASGLTSRLFQKVREEKGLVYHIGSGISPLRHGSGPFVISLGCDPKNTKKAITTTLETVRHFLEDGITEHELELAKSSIKKGFALHSFNSRSASCGTLASLQLRNKDESYVNNYSSMIDSITREQVMAAAAKFIKPANFTIVATKPKDFKAEEINLVTPEPNTKAVTDKKPLLVAA